MSPKVVEVPDLVADVEGEKEQAARPEDAQHLLKGARHHLPRHVHDGVERDNAAPRAVFNVQAAHIALPELDLRVQASPALIQAYRELLLGLVKRATAAGSSSAKAIAEHARQSLLTKHPSLDGFAFSDRPVDEPVADSAELTAAIAA